MRGDDPEDSFRAPPSTPLPVRLPPRPRLAHAVVALIAAACSPAADHPAVGDSVASSTRDAVVSAQTGTTDAAAIASVDTLLMTVYKTPNCGCCRNWVDHVRENGFHAATTDVADVTPVKLTHRVPADLQSCHTALIGGYVIEGHVPAADIHRLLKERPDIIGIAVPGMPSGSPGMETGQVERYDVIAIGKDGSRTVWARHGQ